MTVQYAITGDVEAAKRTVFDTLVAHGYAVTPLTETTYRVERGNKTKTLWLGGLAGKDFHLAFGLEVIGQHIRFGQRVAGSFFKGGAVGMAKADTAFAEVDTAVRDSLVSAGALAGVSAV